MTPAFAGRQALNHLCALNILCEQETYYSPIFTGVRSYDLTPIGSLLLIFKWNREN